MNKLRYFTGQIANARIYPYARSSHQVLMDYRVERLMFMNWYERLWYWCKMTGLILWGKRYIRFTYGGTDGKGDI